MAGFRLSRYRSSTETGAAYGLEFSSELVIGTPHVSTHIDALCHYAFDGRIFGGASVDDVHTDFGFTEHGIGFVRVEGVHGPRHLEVVVRSARRKAP
jgi:kynurenine formamidase